MVVVDVISDVLSIIKKIQVNMTINPFIFILIGLA